MSLLEASFEAFATYHAAVAPVLGTDPAAVDARGVEATTESDNHGKMRPVYIEKSDRRGKKAAHAAVCKLLRQHPSIGDEEFTVTTADIYELRKI